MCLINIKTCLHVIKKRSFVIYYEFHISGKQVDVIFFLKWIKKSKLDFSQDIF